MNVVILHKPWTKVLLEIPKFDWFIWSVSRTLKHDISDWTDDVWWASEMYADMGKKKCGIVIAKVAFPITNTPTTLNVGD